MCDICETNPKEYPLFNHKWLLINARENGEVVQAGQWALFYDGILCTVWNDAPMLAPSEEDDDLNDLYYYKYKKFQKEFVMDPIKGYYLVQSAIKFGYTDHSIDFRFWIFQYFANIINEEN